MEDYKKYFQDGFKARGIEIASNREKLFEEFCSDESAKFCVEQITRLFNSMVDKWNLQNKILDIVEGKMSIPNATVGVDYQKVIDLSRYEVKIITFDDLPQGLSFNSETQTIEGNPVQSGDLKIKMFFRLNCEPESERHEKVISLIVNPDPKSLWKNLPSDRNVLFWKEDKASDFKLLGDKHIVVASCRGRSHQDNGSCRDDDYAFKFIDKNGWSVVAVADGAGSYQFSREGSRLACETVIRYFSETDVLDAGQELDSKIQAFATESDYTKKKELETEMDICSKQTLYKAVLTAHNKIKDVATDTQKQHPELFTSTKAKSVIDYFHTTLIFALFKKFDFGYLVLTFGVGDCPIAVMNKAQTETQLLNWLDVGEYGGGTRFVTQRDIFDSTEYPMASRFKCTIIHDFAYLFLMTDGIYDPKFEVEANLEKHEEWLNFIADLQGNNEDKVKVELDASQTQIAPQYLLLKWLEFWDKGNHDDRTLAIIF